MAKKSAKIPLRTMLQAIDTNDFDFYSRLDKEQRKAFSPWLAMRYASSASGMAAYHYLIMVNHIVNVDFSVFKKHPELQWKLLAVCGQGSSTNHPYVAPGKKKKKNKLEKLLRNTYPTLNKTELELLVEINDEVALKELAQDSGYDDKEIKELFK